MRASLLACTCLLALAPIVAFGQSATGSVDVGSDPCVGSTCGDTVHASLTISPKDVGRNGAVFLVILPTNAKGAITSYRGAYATLSGWKVGIAPVAYGRGALPATWHRDLFVPGGICAMAASQGYKGRLGIYVGYGLTTTTAAPGPSPATAQTLEREAAATHNPAILARVKALLAGDTGPIDGATAQQMLSARTVWPIARLSCE